MAKAKKAAPKAAPKKVAKKVTVKHVQKNNDLVEDQQEQDGLDGLTEEQKVSNVLQHKAT